MRQRNIQKVIMTALGRKRLEDEGKWTTGEGKSEKFLLYKHGNDRHWRTLDRLNDVTGLANVTISKIRDHVGISKSKLLSFFHSYDLRLNEDDYTYVPSNQKLNNHKSDTVAIPPLLLSQHNSIKSEVRGNLPVLQPIIGREKELKDILETLGTEQSRLTILTGLGGMGKTRLAITLGHKVKSKFQDRVWITDFSEILAAEKIEQFIRTELQLQDYQGLEEALGAEPMLLILDNCEHLLKACQQLMKKLLSSHYCPRLHILATSREAFWVIDGQSLYPVEGLEKNDAIGLFVQRSQERGISIQEKDKPAVLEICGSLECFPLAIELAAARARMKLQDIKTGLQKRFEFLSKTDNGDAPERHRSLSATMDWSYELLTEKERNLFHRLSVFKGGWNTDAARTICAEEEDSAEIPDLLWELTNKSLIIFKQEPESRYRMLETLREYAVTKITEQENDSLLERHRQYFLKWVQNASKNLEDKESVAWMRSTDEEYPNLITALTLSLEKRAIQDSLSFCGALQGYWGRRGSFSEGLSWCKQALAKADSLEHPKEQADVLNAAGGLAYYQGDLIGARQFHVESLSIRESIRDNEGVSNSYNNIGLIEYEQGLYASALANFKSCWQIRLELEKLGNSTSIAYILMNVGMAYHAQGDYVTAQNHYDNSRFLFQVLENSEGMAYVDTNCGWMALVQKKYASARVFFKQSQQIFIDAGDQRSLAEVDNGLGLVAIAQGDYSTAWDYLANSLVIRRDVGDQKGIVEAVEAIACLAAVQHQRERADQSWKAAVMLRQRINVPLPPHKQNEYEVVMGKVELETTGAAKGTMTLTQAIKYALTNPNLREFA